MSLGACLVRLEAERQITPEQADEMRALYDDLRRQKAGQYGESAADAMAGEETLRALARAKALEKRQAALQARAQAGLTKWREDAASRGIGTREAALAIFDQHPAAPGFISVEQRFQAIHRLAVGNMAVLFERFGASLFRGRIASGEVPVALVRALFGEPVGDPAIAGMARAVAETFEYLRLRFNAAGGSIGRLADWGLPQAHDMLKVRQAGFEAWRDFIVPLLDRSKMIDHATGAPFTPERLELALRDVFETIRTGGLNAMQPGQIGLGRLANRRGDARFLRFRDADAWLAYQQRFGRDANPFETIVGHLHGMARDIAAMEVLGPNPAQTVSWLMGTLEQEVATGSLVGRDFDRALATARSTAEAVRRLWDSYTGTGNAVAGETLASFASGVRAWLTAAHLGGAVISALSDPVIQGFNRLRNGIPAFRTLFDAIRFLNPLAAEDRLFAAQLGAGMDDAIGHAVALLRYTGEASVNGRVQWLAAAVMRASGLNLWTEAQKRANAWAWSAALANARTKGWDALDAPFRAMLERYGIGRDGWDEIRSTPPVERGGAPFLVPGDLYANPALPVERADELVTRLMAMISSEERASVIQSSLRSRALAEAGGRRGTWSGELVRALMQFKQFPMEFLFRVLGQMFAPDMSVPQKIRYAMIFPALTLAGALVMQLKQVAQGKTPREPDTPQFWLAAALQGGGLGLFGDFMFTTSGRFGRSIAEDLAGPSIGLVSDLFAFTQGNLMGMARGEDTNAGRELARLVRGYVPGSKLWYLRLAWDRYVNDAIQMALDPDYPQAFRRMERRAADEFGQDYWWRPGERAPEPDAVDLILGGSP